MGETISIGDSFIITFFSMVIVFLTLLIISYLIDVLRVVSSKDDDIKRVKVVEKEKMIKKEHLGSDKYIDDEELVAVIASAIACSLGVEIPKVKIKSIRRLPQSSPIWAKVGREDQILNRL